MKIFEQLIVFLVGSNFENILLELNVSFQLLLFKKVFFNKLSPFRNFDLGV